MKIAVIGGGVIGMTTAIAVKNAFPGSIVTVFADKFSPNTTGDGSAGLWGPYILGDNSQDDIVRWAGRTHTWFENFWKCGLAPETGVALIPTFRVTSHPDGYSNPQWMKVVYGAKRLSPDQLNKLNLEHQSKYTGGLHFVTYTCEPTYLLPFLMKKFAQSGGNLVKRKIRSLNELFEEGYDVVINCTGLGARELVNDNNVIPVRGQVNRIKSPGCMHVFIVDDCDSYYIIPNINSTVIGGTHDENDFDTRIRKKDTDFIRNGCTRMIPGLKKTKILSEWVGLRPGRSTVRLEPEVIVTSTGKQRLVIHNYGHGGSGITLSWGCALDVIDIMNDKMNININSKL